MVLGIAPQDASDRLIMFQVCYVQRVVMIMTLIPCKLAKSNSLLCVHFTFKESVRQPVQEVHHLHRGRGVVWDSCYPVSPAAGYKEAADSAAETVWPLQHGH